MSRIHDALKKAALERQNIFPAGVGVSADLRTQVASEPSFANGNGHSGHTIECQPGERKVAGANKDWPESLKVSKWDPDPSKMSPFGQSSAASVEAFRTLRTRLYLMQKQRPLKKVLISSPLSQDGKTFVSASLGRALAQQDERVLLIDGDLRFSKLHTSFGAALAPGLTEYLKGNCAAEDIVQRGAIRNLFLIPGGTPMEEATELLTNGRLEELARKLSADFDWILFDSPPVVPVSDAKVIGDLCDGILIVIRSGSTTLATAQKACREFGESRLLGVVLNGVSPNPADSSSYYEKAKARNPEAC